MANSIQREIAQRFREVTHRLPRLPVIFMTFLLLSVAIVISPLYLEQFVPNPPQAINGTIDFSEWEFEDAVVELGGEWEFYWDQLIESESGTDELTGLSPMPALWSTLVDANGDTYPNSGVASYRLNLMNLPSGKYQVYLPQVYVADRLWVDGVLSSENGRVGRTPTSSKTEWGENIVNFYSPDGGHHTLVLEVSAFHHRANGFEEPPLLAAEQVMEGYIKSSSASEMLFQGILLLLSIYGFTIFFFRPDDRSSLFFALFCLSFLVPSAAFGTNHIELVVPGISFTGFIALVYLPGTLALAFFLLYVTSLYEAERSNIINGLLLIYIAISFVTLGYFLGLGDTISASEFYPFVTLSALPLTLYLVYVIVRAAFNGREGSIMMLLGITFFTVTFANDALLSSNVLNYDQALTPGLVGLGLTIFLLSQVVILAERWSSTLIASERMTDDLGKLVEMSSAISSEVNLLDLLNKVVHSAAEFLDAERGSLFLYDEETDELWSIVAEGISNKEIRFNASKGIAGSCFRTGKTVNVKDAYKDERFIFIIDEETGFITNSILSIPVDTKNGRRLGVMQVLNKRHATGFSKLDEYRIKAFASQAAIALENAELFTDVTEARKYNDSIISSMSNGVISIGRNNHVEKVNESATAILGIEREIDSSPPIENLFGDQNSWIIKDIEEVKETREPMTRVDVELLGQSGTNKSVNVSVVPLILEEQNIGSLVLLDDITEEKRLKGTMSRFMTKEVADQVLASDENLLGGSNYDASIMFSDIRGFTTISEKLGPKQTVSLLNYLFTEIVEEIFEHKGVLDKFIGDAIMAVFGAPVSSGQDSQNAVRSAIGIKHALNRINEKRAQENLEQIRMGIGIATGDVIAGTIGSPKRMEYTVIGDSVNLASRLEALTKQYDIGIAICDQTKSTLSEVHLIRELDLIRVRGQKKPNQIWQVLDYHNETSFPNINEMLSAYEVAMDLWKDRDWQGALDSFQALQASFPFDKVISIYVDRCHKFVRTPPPEGWDGVWDTL